MLRHLKILLFVFVFSITGVLAQGGNSQTNLSKLPDDIWVNYDSKILKGKELKRYYDLIGTIRCPVCQGQSIAESNAQIAKDLKGIVYQKIIEGLTAKEIKAILVGRYGSYINFDPPVNKTTLPLWFLPFIIALVGIGVIFYRSRTRRPFEKWK